ncbi:hypothetical protein IFM89_028784 [Coptis chinensis]|uniref:NAC domain-containing protein n=1 Tax=Coptis chinensis TaxID=261450 RepID=A0A835GZZ5_9MAGN|nr:hypothetical protein IFM89_028784 [Coptis chinensis]
MVGLKCCSLELKVTRSVSHREKVIMELEKMKSSQDMNKDDDSILLPGFRFHPTDEELVGFYLRRKVDKKPLSIELIKQIDIYKYDPWDLPISSVGEKEMYFFCIRERKYRNSIRPNRVTGSGFWKATGIDRPIYSIAGETDDCIGLKKSLVYYRGSAGKGTKTDWMMHEFRLPATVKSTNCNLPSPKNNTLEAEIWTLCRIFKRNASYRKYAPAWRETPIKQNPSDSNSQTNSLESVNRDKSFGAPVVQQKQSNKQFLSHTEERVHMFPDQLGSLTTTPAQYNTTVYSNSISFNSSELFLRDRNWDELGTIVEFASDSSLLYGCK